MRNRKDYRPTITAYITANYPVVGDMAKAYVDVLLTPPNAWGRHCHPVFGDSTAMLWEMHQRFGGNESNAAVETEINRRKAELEN